MVTGRLGKVYKDGETIIEQGRTGENFYVIQSGRVEVVQSTAHGEQHLIYLDTGESFGEMAVFEKEVRSATIRAVGEARVLKIDKKTLLQTHPGGSYSRCESDEEDGTTYSPTVCTTGCPWKLITR